MEPLHPSPFDLFKRELAEKYPSLNESEVDKIRQSVFLNLRGSGEKGLRFSRKKGLFPFSFWMQSDQQKKICKVQFYGNFFAAGAYKKVKESATVVFSFDAKAPNFQWQKTALIRLKTKKSYRTPCKDPLDLVDNALDSFELLKENLCVGRENKAHIGSIPELLLEQINARVQRLFSDGVLFDTAQKLQLAGIPQTIRCFSSSVLKVEWEEPFFDGDAFALCRALHVSTEEQREKKWKGFGLLEIFSMGKKVLHSLKILHERGLVHADVKLDNILIDNGQGASKTRFCLSDFNLSRPIERDEKILNHYPYWDPAAHEGWFLPTCDLHGLFFSLSQVIFGPDANAMTRLPREEREKTLDSLFYEFVLREFKAAFFSLKQVDQERLNLKIQQLEMDQHKRFKLDEHADFFKEMEKEKALFLIQKLGAVERFCILQKGIFSAGDHLLDDLRGEGEEWFSSLMNSQTVEERLHHLQRLWEKFPAYSLPFSELEEILKILGS